MVKPEKIRCIIVDDEPLARSVIKEHCLKVNFIEIIAECKNAIEATSVLHNNNVELIFLDINMPYLSGIDFAKQLNPSPAIVFTTAYSEYAVEGFELDAIDYLVKPISFNRFFKCANKVLKWLGKDSQEALNPTLETEKNELSANPFLYLKEGDKMVRVYLNEIVAIESQGHYVKIYTSSKKHVIHQSISEMEERLPAESFVRTHRSFIAGLKHVSAYSAGEIDTNQLNIPIGRNYKSKVMERLKG